MKVQRQEHKFIINRCEAGRLIRQLEQIMPRDSYSQGPEGYEVRSLYFDTLSDRSYAEKLDGLETHEKIRLRVYGTDDSVIKLESKKKIGDRQTKLSMLIDRELEQQLARGRYKGLLELQNPAASYFYSKLSAGMMPKSIIQYKRLSFCLDTNNTRITFDSDIRSTECCRDIFQEPLQANPILSQNIVIMEVKFNNFLLSYIQDALRGVRQLPSAYSKYANGRSFARTMI